MGQIVNETSLIILDFTYCPPTQQIIPNQMDRYSPDFKKYLYIKSFMHSNAAGLTPEGY